MSELVHSEPLASPVPPTTGWNCALHPPGNGTRAQFIVMGAMFMAFAVAAATLAPHHCNSLYSDSLSYIRIALYYEQGNYDLAVNGYWGPMLSWLIALFHGPMADPLLAARAVMVLSALVFFAGCYCAYRACGLGPGGVLAGACAAAIVGLDFSLRAVTPDLLLAGLLAFVFAIIFSSHWLESRFVPFLAGMGAGMAYLTKVVALPTALGGAALFAVLMFIAKRAAKRTIARAWGFTALGFLVVALPWMTVISLKYEHPTIGTSGAINHAILHFGDPIGFHPSRYSLHVPEAGRLTSWEDPSRMPYRFWSPFESKAFFKHQIVKMWESARFIVKYLASFDVLKLGPVALVLALLAAWPWRAALGRDRWRWAGIAGLSVGAPYLAAFADSTRYYLPAYPFLLACAWGGASAVAQRLLSKDANDAPTTGMRMPALRRSAAGAIVALVTVSFLLTAGTGLYGRIKNNPIEHGPRQAQEVARQITRHGASGPVAGGRNWFGLFVAYYLDTPWYGDSLSATPDDFTRLGAEIVIADRGSSLADQLAKLSQFAEVPVEAPPDGWAGTDHELPYRIYRHGGETRWKWKESEFSAPIEGDAGTSFDLLAQVEVDANVPAVVGGAFAYRDEQNHYLFRMDQVSTVMVEVRDGNERLLARSDSGLTKGQSHALALHRRENLVVVSVDGCLAGSAYLDTPIKDSEPKRSSGTVRLAGQARFTGVRLVPRPASPLVWADDFMRAWGERGDWETSDGGTWRVLARPNSRLSANPFCFNGVGKQTQVMAGSDYWMNYTLAVSVRASSEGRLGAVVAATDAKRCFLFRGTVLPDGAAKTGCFEIIRRTDAREEVMASMAGGFRAGQWYRIEVDVYPGCVEVWVDGNRLLYAVDPEIIGGRVGLWADSTQLDIVHRMVDGSVSARPKLPPAPPPPPPTQGRVVAFDRKNTIVERGDHSRMRIDNQTVAFIDYGGVVFDDVEVRPLTRFSDASPAKASSSGSWYVSDGAWRYDQGVLSSVRGTSGRALLASMPMADFMLRADVMLPVQGKMGFLFHVLDAARYDVVWLDAVEVQFCRVRGPEVQILASCKTRPTSGSWKVCSEKGYVRVFAGEQAVVDAWAPLMDNSGSAGVISDNAEGAVVRSFRFDAIPVSTPDSEVTSKAFAEEESMEPWAGSEWYVGSHSVQGATVYWNRGVSFGDMELTVDLEYPAGAASERLVALSIAKPRIPDKNRNGYVFEFRLPETWPGTTSIRLSRDRNAVTLTAPDGAIGETMAVSLRDRPKKVGIRRTGPYVTALMDDRPVARYRDPEPLPGGKTAYYTTGLRAPTERARITCGQTLDYAFGRAPVDWFVAGGRWEIAGRWQCDPSWTFFSGFYTNWPMVPKLDTPQSEKLAAIWNKHPVDGELDIEYFVAPKMQLEAEQNFGEYSQRRDYNLALLKDPADLTSGYIFAFGAAGNKRSVIYRKGVPVATSPAVIERAPVIVHLFTHHYWYAMRMIRMGKSFKLYAMGKPVLEFEDPAPMDGPFYVCLWTYRNGIVLGRVRIAAERVKGMISPEQAPDRAIQMTIQGPDSKDYQ